MENTNEAAGIAGAAKVVAGIAKTGAKTAAKASAKGAKKGTKVASKTADRMAKAYQKNKSLIKNKEGLPSKKVANSGKKTVDPKKNNLPDMSNVKPDGVDKKTSKDTLDRKKERKDDAISDTAKDIVQKVQTVTDPLGTAVKKVGNAAKKSTSAVSGAFGTSSFRKESKITFKDYLNKL